MTSRSNGISRGQKEKDFHVEGPNWILIVGGALFSTLSIRLGYMLKQALDSKQQANATNSTKGNERSPERRRRGSCHIHSNLYSFTQDDDGSYNCISGNEGFANLRHRPNDQLLSESDVGLPLLTIRCPEFPKENGVVWVSSSDRLELPPKPFHHLTCSDSPYFSESGSDILSKREVIQKLRQQVKRRDDMIMEMQDQILELRNSLNAQLAHSTNWQLQLDVTNRDFFDSEREIQRLRKAIADHCVNQVASCEKPPTVPIYEVRNSRSNGYVDGDGRSELSEKGKGDMERIEMLKREVGDLKEVIEGKEFLLQRYKEREAGLSTKVKELQQRLDSQLPIIL